MWIQVAVLAVSALFGYNFCKKDAENYRNDPNIILMPPSTPPSAYDNESSESDGP